jgi:outer membrane protein OmpA-like peptidoglycan-associated protein
MATVRFPLRWILTFIYLCLGVLVMPTSAQQVDVNGVAYESEEQASGCPRLQVLPPLPSSKVVSCQNSDSVEISIPLQPDATGASHEKKVTGKYQFREYQIGKYEQPIAFDSLVSALPMAGFIVKYTNKPSTISARNGDTWILINVSDELYNVTVVQAPPDAWILAQTAKEISSEMQSHGRVDIYGIEFSPTDQSIVEAKSPILAEVAKYLKQNPGVSVIIESDKVSSEGPPEEDAEITRERANAVMDWLIAHGIERTRLQPWPAGRNNPITENESPSEIQRNERIVLKTKPL